MVNDIGSGLDVNAIVDGLMAIQQRELTKLNQKKVFFENQNVGYTKFKGLLKQFTDNLDSLKTILQKKIYKIQSSDESAASAAISSQSAATGSYELQINQLAQAHQVASSAFTSKTDALMLNGQLTITIGNKTLNVSLDNADSLETVRNHINDSLNNPGLTVNILKTTDSGGQDEYRLVLSSKEMGLANKMTIGGEGLTSLGLSNTLHEAQNAKLTINGFQVERSTNAIDDAIEGISLHLNRASANAIISVTPDQDNTATAITTAFGTFINSYNQMMEMISKNQSSSQLRDGTYSLIKLNLKQAMDKSFGNDKIKSLLDLGIKLEKPQIATNDEGVEYAIGGKISISSEQLSKVLKENLSEVRAFFIDNSENFIKSIKFAVGDIESKTIPTREKVINEQTSYTNRSIDNEESRLDVVRQNLTNKYAALDVFLARYKQISQFLDQQLSAMQSMRSK